MQTDIYSAPKWLNSWGHNEDYLYALKCMASLSRLFSESQHPFLDYRITENLFCLYFHAQNDARSCTAYDARIEDLGIGIKTFILSENDNSIEKIAEFNKLKPQWENLKGEELAIKLGTLRNERMAFANNLFNVNNSIYHIVGRGVNTLKIFNHPYDFIDLNNIRNVKEKCSGLSFEDGKCEYFFNKSKSVLMKRFFLPEHYINLEIKFIENPLDFLLKCFDKNVSHSVESKKQILFKEDPYVILPLYSVQKGVKYVPKKSGLNQWNAGGRKRDLNEVYIPIPQKLHHLYPNFFPDRNVEFELYLPDGVVLSAKVCQDSGKALMSNPNKKLGEWILRKVLKKEEGELVTIDDFDKFGIDSIKICKKETIDNKNEKHTYYTLSFFDTPQSYSNFIEE